MSFSQEGIDGLWKELCGNMEEEVLDKYAKLTKQTNKFVCQGRGEPLKWRVVKKESRC